MSSNIVKKKINRSLFIAVVLGILLLLIAVRLSRGPSRIGTQYEQYQVTQGTISKTVSGIGRVTTLQKEVVYASSGGQITQLNAPVGSVVKKGDVLLKYASGGEIKAPFDGEVTQVFVKANEWLNPSARLVEVTDYINLEITAQVDELDVTKISTGQLAQIDINALDAEELSGPITSIAREGIFSGGITTFAIKVAIPDSTGLLVGLSAEIKAEVARAQGVIVVPVEAVQYNGNQPYVLVGSANTDLEQITVELGLSDGQLVEVKNGLALGQNVFYPKPAVEEQLNFGPGLRGAR